MQVTFDGITLGFGDRPLFSRLDLTLPGGQFFTLLGPSGCGKTTLLRLLAGFVRPDAGRVLFGQRDVTATPAHRRGVGIVFQDYALFPDRSVADNVAYGLLARKMPKADIKARVNAMLERVGLAEFADRPPAALSGGQRQRVAMARALVIEPALLLLDEPLSALDVKLRVELRGMIRDLQREAGITTVFVTHDQEEALALSDQIAVMDKGRIVQVGTPRDIYTRPRTAFAADFVGHANLIPLLRELPPDGEGPRRFETPAGILLSDCDARWQPGCALAVRGAEIALTDATVPRDGELAGIIGHVEYRGSTVRYTVRTAAGPIRVDDRVHRHTRLRDPGDAVVLGLPASAPIVEGLPC
ncbi:ABC transporter ATP-binding protein [Paludibacterium paludis]|uniref:ABC transporter ATP-binding protein n=1 Tax=Paludibacterium paludis TaxID=1225769 RepID=A0A918UA69_9NEIS|nr:ABC transporter ATP-binding protein [Paludibacterium paludis]GGY20043.1 ABC transporter ATP-binding protein [Paludibacterium paludis]